MLTKMWADAQRDSRPVEARWRPQRRFRNFIHRLVILRKI